MKTPPEPANLESKVGQVPDLPIPIRPRPGLLIA